MILVTLWRLPSTSVGSLRVEPGMPSRRAAATVAAGAAAAFPPGRAAAIPRSTLSATIPRPRLDCHLVSVAILRPRLGCRHDLGPGVRVRRVTARPAGRPRCRLPHDSRAACPSLGCHSPSDPRPSLGCHPRPSPTKTRVWRYHPRLGPSRRPGRA